MRKAYVQVDCLLEHSPSFVAFAEALRDAADEWFDRRTTYPGQPDPWLLVVHGLLVRVWSWIAMHRPAGDLLIGAADVTRDTPRVTRDMSRDALCRALEGAAGWGGTRAALFDLFVAHFCSGENLTVNGWAERYGVLIERKRQARERQALRRRRLASDSHAADEKPSRVTSRERLRDVTANVTPDKIREEKRREEKSITTTTPRAARGGRKQRKADPPGAESGSGTNWVAPFVDAMRAHHVGGIQPGRLAKLLSGFRTPEIHDQLLESWTRWCAEGDRRFGPEVWARDWKSWLPEDDWAKARRMLNSKDPLDRELAAVWISANTPADNERPDWVPPA